MGPCARWAAVALLFASAGWAEPLPVIGVGGGLRLGYGGALRRAGLPFTYLTDREQCELEALQRCDVVLVAGLWTKAEPWSVDSLRTLDSYVRAGGRAICEMGSRPPGALAGLKFEYRGARLPPSAEDPRDFRLVRGDHPFLKLLPAGRRWSYGGPCTRVTVGPDSEDVTVLARFVAGPASGQPAVIARRYGRGELLYFAAEISYIQGNWTPAYEDLILAGVRYLVGERGRAQWAEPRGVVLEASRPEPPAACPPRPGWFALGAAPPDGYCLRITVPERTQRVLLEPAGGADLTVSVGPARLTVATERSLRLTVETQPGDELALQRRTDRLEVTRHGAVLASTALRVPPAGGCYIAGDGADHVVFQPVEPVWFADDFTRSGAVGGGWRVRSGRWRLTGSGAPYLRLPEFALRGRGVAEVGEWTWRDYHCEVAVRPIDAREIRLGSLCWDEGNRLELRCPVGQGRPSLVRLRDGRETVLAAGGPPLWPRQWSRLALDGEGDRVWAEIDGGKVLEARCPDLGHGGMALAALGGEAVFDDVRAVGAELDAGLPVVHPPDYDKGPDGLLDRDTWSHPAAAWIPGRERGRFTHVGRFVGDFSLTVPFRPSGARPQLAILAGGEREAVVPVVSTTRGPRLRLERRGGRLRAWQGSTPLALSARPEGSLVLGLSFTDLSLAPADITLTAADVYECTFDRPPADWWEAEGRWQVGARWPCQPQWAWLTGDGVRRAVLWHKLPVRGDLVVEAYLGPRMLGQYGGVGNEPFERLRLTIGGDGRDPWSGYVVELGSDVEGLHRLYRRHTVVASSVLGRPHWREVHNLWADLRVERHGHRITAWFQDRKLFEYEDPKPLGDGQVCLWTERNSVVTPYLAIYGERVPRPAALDEAAERRRWWRAQLLAPRFGAHPEHAWLALARLLGQ